MSFSIFTQTKKELDEFFQQKVHIAGIERGESVRFLKNKTRSYEFSQWETVNDIEMYYNSKFKSGLLDSEGYRKIFLNICKFRSDVASKQVDLDTKDFNFVPEDANSVWGAFFANKMFRTWAKENYFGELLNQVVIDYPKYGTAVIKKVGKELERVPLMTLRVQQDAKDLKTARYVIIEHEEMSLDDMNEMKGWDTKGLEMKFGETDTVFERYGKVPLSFLKEKRGETPKDGDDMIGVDTLSITVLRETKGDKSVGGHVLFLDEIKERPLEEVHWSKIDGRWLGVGEIENQFENQITRNMVENLRRRNLMWSAKKIFQSPSTEVAKNLVRDVRDGEIISIMPNGHITQVNMATQAQGDFAAFTKEWEDNSNQKSFTFEVATGESLPSGTPFRLGVVLSNAVNSHFGLKQENLGLFWKRVVTDQLFPEFKKQNNKETIVRFASGEDGINLLKKGLIEVHTNKEILETMLKGTFPQAELIRQEITNQIEQRKDIFTKLPDKFWDDIKLGVELVITGESMDVNKKIETMTNVFNSLLQQQDPRAGKVLERTLALTGENMENIAGPAEEQAAQQQQAQAQDAGISGAFAQAAQGPEGVEGTL